MNKSIRAGVRLSGIRLAALALLLAGSVLLSGCSNLVNITYKDGKYIDKADGVTYLGAGVSYEPISVGKKYAKYGKTVLYEISGLKPTQWLTEAYEGIGSLYYAEYLTLPGLGEFKPDKILICISSELLMHMATIEDADYVRKIADAIVSGEETDLPQDGTDSYQLKFSSGEYPGIYYSILYIEGKDSKNYLYDRGTKKCVEIGDLLELYLPSDNNDGDDAADDLAAGDSTVGSTTAALTAATAQSSVIGGDKL